MRRVVGFAIILFLIGSFLLMVFLIFKAPSDCETPKSWILPNHVHVGEVLYEVKLVSPVEMENNLGTCEYVTKVISIRTGQTKESEGIVFVHEILHAAFWEGEIPLWRQLQEEIVKRIAPLVYHALSSHTIFQ